MGGALYHEREIIISRLCPFFAVFGGYQRLLRPDASFAPPAPSLPGDGFDGLCGAWI